MSISYTKIEVAREYYHIDNGGIQTEITAYHDNDDNRYTNYILSFELGQHGRTATMSFDLENTDAIDSIIDALTKTKKFMVEHPLD